MHQTPNCQPNCQTSDLFSFPADLGQEIWQSSFQVADPPQSHTRLQAVLDLPPTSLTRFPQHHGGRPHGPIDECTRAANHLMMSDFNVMDRTLSAPAWDHSPPQLASSCGSLQRSLTNPTDWCSTTLSLANDLSSFHTTSMQDCMALDSIGTGFGNSDMIVYTPADYINARISSSLSPSSNLVLEDFGLHSSRDGHWQSVDFSHSSNISSAAMTPCVSQLGHHANASDPFLDTPFLSDSSSFVPAENGAFPFRNHSVSQSIISHDDDVSCLSFDGLAKDALPCLPRRVSSSAHEFTFSSEGLMIRSASLTGSESHSSDFVESSVRSRPSRRNQEIKLQAASRLLAPKGPENIDEAMVGPTMAKIHSTDGLSKTVGILSRAPYVRPQHPKIMCQWCTERPDGFRGTHELDRHIARAHAPKRKGYICVDYWADKNFLSNCKHCRSKKVYGAYYNAAAHLRRAHFHPRKRGRKGKNDEKRGGIGGGDHPAMDHLKQYWIQEVEVNNKSLPQSPNTDSDELADPMDDAYRATYSIPSAYSSKVNAASAAVVCHTSIDLGQLDDYGMNIHHADPFASFDSTRHTCLSTMLPTNNFHNFQFDACPDN